MLINKIPLVDWGNGVLMIGVFALVCIILIAILINFMNSESKKKDNSNE